MPLRIIFLISYTCIFVYKYNYIYVYIHLCVRYMYIHISDNKRCFVFPPSRFKQWLWKTCFCLWGKPISPAIVEIYCKKSFYTILVYVAVDGRPWMYAWSLWALRIGGDCSSVMWIVFHVISCTLCMHVIFRCSVYQQHANKYICLYICIYIYTYMNMYARILFKGNSNARFLYIHLFH